MTGIAPIAITSLPQKRRASRQPLSIRARPARPATVAFGGAIGLSKKSNTATIIAVTSVAWFCRTIVRE
jgi:hypothetical protein